ncbi:unnamed protein product [Urochloa humidicola]
MLTSRDDNIVTRSWKRNKRADELTRSSKKKKIISNGGEITELLISGDLHRGSNQCFWSELSKEVASKLSKSVVSLALPNGQEFACSGIALECVGNVTRFLTSASLARALVGNRSDHDNLKVEVRLGCDVVIGFLGQYDLDHEIAVVNVMSVLDVNVVHLVNLAKLEPVCKVVALGHDISGDVMATDGIMTGNSSRELKLSTCKISKVYEGGALFDFGGNFLGMNFFRDAEGTFFLPAGMVIHWLGRFTSLRLIKFPVCSDSFRAVRVGQRFRGEVSNSNSNEEVHRDVPDMNHYEYLGYPKPSISMLNDGMILINSFEEPFGDECGKGVWRELSETASSNIHENIVALASFNGETRFSACTGFFIEWNGCSAVLASASLVRKPGYENKIVENLRIEVLLPTKDRVEGTLQHYNLHYNVALVSVKGFHACDPAKVRYLWNDSCDAVVAVGYCFESCKLMAARGEQFARPVTLDCEYLCYSTCKITKAGIGGPLLDFDGRFIGMNFYEKKVGTPYLNWREILVVLEHFKTEGSVAKVDHGGKPSCLPGWTMAEDCSVGLNRWPVPKPCWCHPDDPKIRSTGYM